MDAFVRGLGDFLDARFYDMRDNVEEGDLQSILIHQAITLDGIEKRLEDAGYQFGN